ncbi:DUF6622 family protein [Telluria beijingensis]|uniref:DUF6622 family protein n=1 Tax=Telluria beijingensis TaxID=3068633 RepID=UPI002795A761|nr:DUF6622 family protein [Massilia sp. REN29]
MPIQILSHTPLYVWAILAFLVWRGVVEMREREIALSRMAVLPLVMLVLSLHDIALKLGLGPASLGAWFAGCLIMVAPAWKLGSTRIAAVTAPGHVLVRGSVLPLLVMMAIFGTKYATSVMLALQPAAVQQVKLAICGLYGVFSGWFIGRLLRVAVDCSRSSPVRPA